MTQEFHISVTPVGEDEYLVRTERVAPGVPLAEEQVSWPVEAWLAQARQLMNDPLLGLLRGDPVPSMRVGAAHPFQSKAYDSLPSASLVSLGQQLYNALFQGTIRDSWMTAKGIAQHRGEFLRLRLGLKGNRLPYLPWEVLHAGDRPIATGTDVVFSRYQSTFTPTTSVRTRQTILESNQCLRILMVIAAPDDQDILELKQEAIQLQEELQSLRNSSFEATGDSDLDRQRAGQGNFPEIQLTLLDQPGRERLTQALEQGRYDVLHYAGHSNLGASGGNLYLVSDKTGLTEALSGDDLAGLLVNNGIRMAVFNSCRGVYTSTAERGNAAEAGNLAEALIKRGIPAVLAMAERIPDDVALTLSQLFYRNLKQAYPADLSLSRARQGLISAYGSHQPYWALPILYLHPEFDGYLQSTGELPDRPTNNSLGYQGLDNLELPLIDYQTKINSDQNPISELTTGLEAEPDQPDASGDDFHSTDQDDLAKLVENIEYDDLNYEEDATVVSDLIRQLSVPDQEAEEPLIRASEAESLLPNTGIETGLEIYTKLPDNPLYSKNPGHGSSPTPSLNAREKARSAELKQPMQGNLAETIAAYQQAIRLNPDDVRLYHSLSLALYQQGNVAEAIAAYDRALQLNPALANAPSPIPVQAPGEVTVNASNLSNDAAVSSPASTTSVMVSKAHPLSFTRHHPTQPRRFKQLLAGLGIAGVSLVALGVSWHQGWLRLSWFGTPDYLPSIPFPVVATTKPGATPQPLNVDFKKADTATVTAIALERFNQNDLKTAQLAVEALLDRGALPQAKTALEAVPANQVDNPEVSFLKGRLAWQFMQTSNSNYSIDDVRRFWETARQRQDSPRYRNALGFAYYAEGKLDRAYQAWFDSLYLIEAKQAQKSGSQPTPEGTLVEPNMAPSGKDALTAYAGMALVLMKSAKTQPPDKQAMLLSEAIKLRKKVLTDDPGGFQPEALGRDWLWNEATIADWQTLLKQTE